MQELAPLAGRPLSPAPGSLRHTYVHSSIDMEIDATPTPPTQQGTPARALMGESRIRTPLPSGPRVEKPVSMPPLAAAPPPMPTLPHIDLIKSGLDTAAARYLSGPCTGRYSAVEALLMCWQDEDGSDALLAMEDLGTVFRECSFSYKILQIPPSSSSVCTNPQRWLSREINDFTEDRDTRDVLKIVYYNGYTFLEDGEMVLARYSTRHTIVVHQLTFL